MGAVNPPQQSTGGEQSAVVPSQHRQQGSLRSHCLRLIMAASVPVNECLCGHLFGNVDASVESV